MGLRPFSRRDCLSDPAPWQRLSPRARRAILLTSFGPPLVLIFVWTPFYLMWAADPTELHLALLVAATAGLTLLGVALLVRLLLILRRESAPPKPEKVSVHQLAKFGLALLVFGAVYLLAIYAVVFGLQPLDASSESGAIAATLILLAVMFGLPVAFYFGLKALGVKDSWTA